MTVSLSPQAIAWLERSLDGGARFQSAHLLAGSTTATLYRIEYIQAGQPAQAVLRLFTNAAWLRTEPDIPLHEAAALQTATELGLSAPRLLALDVDGASGTIPALLMTCLPGQVDLTPADPTDWLQQQARFLAQLHTRPVPSFHWHLRPYVRHDRLTPPPGSSIPHLWQRLFEIVRAQAPAYTPCFIHRDFHPVNLLWQNGQLTGAVDWVNACLGPAGLDVAWNRQNLTAMYGLEAADHFLHLYEQERGTAWHYDPYWDLFALADWSEEPFTVYAPWPQLGLTHLTAALVTTRLEDYLRRLLEGD